MKKRSLKVIICTLIFALVFTNCSYVFGAKKKKEEIKVESQGAIVYCENTGEIVYEKNINKELSPLSITKLMTVLLAIQNLPLDGTVTVSSAAANQPGARLGISEGETLKIEDLIYGALYVSGNDAAYALAEAVSGSVDSFVDLMNTTAKNIGCKNTHFSNPTGLPSPKHYSSAYDTMQIGKIALSNSFIKEIVKGKEHKIEETNKSKARTIKNGMEDLKKSFPGVYGGKTGFNTESDCSAIIAYEKSGLRLWIVVLGTTKDERKKDLGTLIDYGEKKVEGVKVIGENKEVCKVRIKHGEKTRVTAYTSETGYAYLPKEASKTLIREHTVVRRDIEAPVKAGTVVGELEIYVADEYVNGVPLVISEDIDEGWFPSYLGISNVMTVVILAIIMVIFGLYIWIISIRAKHKRRKKAEKKAKIMEIAMKEMEEEREHKERNWRF